MVQNNACPYPLVDVRSLKRVNSQKFVQSQSVTVHQSKQSISYASQELQRALSKFEIPEYSNVKQIDDLSDKMELDERNEDIIGD